MRALLRPWRRELLRLSTLSVVIPTLDAEPHLAGCIAALGEVGEIIVADGGSSDGTIDLAARSGARIVEAERGRGRQLRAGAAAAAGEWLLFLHADTRLGKVWGEAAEAHFGRPGEAACFRFRLDSRAWQARLIERGVAARMRVLGLPYGDQGLLIARSLYDRIGGYRPLPLMEDVDLARRLGPIRVLDADAVTSAERWHRDGWFRRSARNLSCLGLYGCGMAPERIARLYG